MQVSSDDLTSVFIMEEQLFELIRKFPGLSLESYAHLLNSVIMADGESIQYLEEADIYPMLSNLVSSGRLTLTPK